MERSQYEQALANIRKAETVVVDIESNGLQPYSGNRIIGVAVHIPFGESYYFPFRHGLGTIPVDLADPTKGFHEMKWSEKGKKDLYLRYWWDRTEIEFENLPAAWEDELKAILLRRH